MTSDQRKVWHLRRIDLFASMTQEEIERLATLLDDQFVPPGAELLGNRERDRVFLVKRGAVRLYEELNAHQVTLALLGPGKLFGLSSTFGDDSPALSAQTMTESYMCFSTWPRLVEVLSGHPQVILRMMRGLAEQVFHAETWLARVGTRSPRTRLADLLIELCDEFGEPVPGGRRIQFRVTQLDLARMVGVSRETVSRLMTELRTKGIISREHGRLIIHDRARLAEEMTAQE